MSLVVYLSTKVNTDHSIKMTWQDKQVGFLVEDPTKLVFSDSQRYTITGEAWLNGQQNNSLNLIAQSIEQAGIQSIYSMSGAYSLIIWDKKEQVLSLIRDPIGARTIYYTKERSNYWISTNLHSLSSFHSRKIDPISLRDYLCCAFVPGERTLWQDVKELRPGTILTLPDDKKDSFWHLEENIPEHTAEITVYGEQLRQLFDRGVQAHLPEQKPVGVFLSGGLDSSVVTALTKINHKQEVHTYSIYFGDKHPNELEFSGLVARHYQTNHHILEITLEELWEKLPLAMSYLDDPIGDPLTVPNLLLGKLAKERVGVILNGEGGDPCFGGPKNQPMILQQLYGQSNSDQLIFAYLRSFQKCFLDLQQLLKPDIWQLVKLEPYIFSEELNRSGNYLNRLMKLNILYKGADHILTKVNNLTTANQLQGQSPLFDREIVDFSMSIPPQYKLSGVIEKAVLKEAVVDILPKEIIDRPKSGMMVPVQFGFRHPWNRRARRLLLDPKAKIANYLNQDLIRQWLDFKGDPWNRYGVKLWLIASLEFWLRAH